MDTTIPPLAAIGIDIGKEVFHVVGFSTDGRTAFRRKINSTDDSLDAIANEFGIAKETGRNQLRSIFEKTGVHRQAEWVALCSASVSQAMGFLSGKA